MEARRILGGRMFLITLLCLVTLNCFFFAYRHSIGGGDFRTYGNAYHQKLSELSGHSWEEVLEFCADYQDNVYEELVNGTWPNNVESNTELTVIEQLEFQYEYLSRYEAYLEKIEKDAKKLQSVSLFADSDSYVYKNVIRTADDFRSMKGKKISAGHDLAVTEVFEDSWADYSVILLIGLVCSLFVVERKAGLWPMIYAASGGRQKLAFRRIGILLGAAWISTIVIIGTKILFCGWIFHGLEEQGRLIQSIPMFQNVPVPMTIGQFWVFYLTVKAMGGFLIGLVLWLVLSAISNLGMALCCLGLLIGVEYLCTVIPLSSVFVVLRYVNIFSYVDYLSVFVRYFNLSFLGMLISGSNIVLVILVPLCVLFGFLNVNIAGGKYPVVPVNRLLRKVDGLVKKSDQIFSGGGLLAQEMKKLMIKRRGVVLVVLLAVVLAQTSAPAREYNLLDMYFQYYEDKYAGPITEDTIEKLEMELQKSTESDRSSALKRMISQVKAAPKGAWLVPTGPYDAIWSDNYANSHRTTALIALLFLVFLLAPVASQERQAGMTCVQNSSSGGRGHLWRKKQTLLLICVSLVWLAVYGNEIYKTILTYGELMCLNAPLFSLAQFRDYDGWLSIGQFLTVYYGLKWLVLLVSAEICYVISGWCEQNKTAILMCSGVLLIPAALAALGSTMGMYLSVLLPLAGQGEGVAPEMYGVLLLIGGSALIYSCLRSR